MTPTRMALSYAKHPVLNGSSGPGCHGVSSSLGSGRGGGAGSRWDAKNPATTAKTLGKDGKRCTNCEWEKKWEDFFSDVSLGKPQFLKLFFERLFGSSSVGVVLQLVNKNKVLVTRDYSRFQGGSKSYVATLLSVTWYLLVVGYSELVRTSIARFMRKQLTEVITNFKTSNL